MLTMYDLAKDMTTKEISYDEFLTMVDEGKVKEVVIGHDKLVITPKKEESKYPILDQLTKDVTMTYYTGIVEDETLSARLYAAKVKFSSEIPDTASALFWNFVLTIVLPFGGIFLLMFFMTRKISKGGGLMGIGKSNAFKYITTIEFIFYNFRHILIN